MTIIDEITKKLVQPSLADLRDYYAALPKRAEGATTYCAEYCLIAKPMQEKVGPSVEIEVQPNTYGAAGLITLTNEVDEDDWVDITLDPALNGLARYFDHYVSPYMQVDVTAGACVRIIERFAKKEGITLE